MRLAERMRADGDFLFQWRSYVPLLFLPLMILTFPEVEPIERLAGEFWEDAYEIGCFLLVVGGLIMRALTIGFVPARTSGRNTRGQVASVLNTTGLYSISRNPLYLGNIMTYLGIVLLTQNLMLALAFAFFLVIYYERIILAEETFLAQTFGRSYSDWAARVPVFLPRLGGWVRPDLPFSIRFLLRREYPGWFAVVLFVAAIELSEGIFGTEPDEHLEPEWIAALAVGTAVFVVLHLLNRRTRLLKAPGR